MSKIPPTQRPHLKPGAGGQSSQLAHRAEMGRIPEPISEPAADAPAKRPQAPAPELTDHHRPARPQHARDLAEGGLGIRHEAQHGHGDHDIEPPSGKRQRLRPPGRKIHGDPGVTRLDRLARSTAELLRISEVITEKTAGLQSLDEPWADTTTPSGRMILTVFAGIAEFERHLIRSRTEDGRRAAQARGVAFGRPRKMSKRQEILARELVREGKSISEVARTFNVHPATVYRCLEHQDGL